MLARLLFVFSVVVVSYLYGVASFKFNLFPHNIIHEAKLAFEALREIDAGRAHGTPDIPGFEFFDKPGSELITVGPDLREGGSEWILVSGGFYYRRDICPETGCLAWLMNRKGEVKHAWPYPLDLWKKVPEIDNLKRSDQLQPIGLHLYENGDLLASFQGHNVFPFGVGMARFNAAGEVVWSLWNNAHHWFSVDDGGRIYTAALKQSQVPFPFRLNQPAPRDVGMFEFKCHQDILIEDMIAVVDDAGREIERHSVIDILVNSGFSHVLADIDSPCDPTHLNYVQVVTGPQAAEEPLLEKGDLIISLFRSNTIAIVSQKDWLIKWIRSGMTRDQHSPRLIGNGRMVAFDNQGGPRHHGGSRIAVLALNRPFGTTLFPSENTPESERFYSPFSSYIDVSKERSHIIASVSRMGRIVEIELATGKKSWDYMLNADLNAFVPSWENSDEFEGRLPPARLATHTVQYVDPEDLTFIEKK